MTTIPQLKKQRCGFTLVELMAVVVIICFLVGTISAIGKYVNRQMGIARAKAQMAALQMALEAYKADVGYYPASTWVRYSGYGSAELSNAACLYRALTKPKCYYHARQADVGSSGWFTYFKDPWGTPWNYYRPAVPQPTTLVVCNISSAVPTLPLAFSSYAYGGQHNLVTYDLFSFGPDKTTTIIGASPIGAYMWANSEYEPGHDSDDIVNWQR